jgi:uncharacterized phiE125 gp8 family phage protein
MIYTEKIVTAPTDEPVDLTTAKAHLRVSGTDDDTYISGIITVARVEIEQATNRALLTQTWDLWVDRPNCHYSLFRQFPHYWNYQSHIYIPRGPVKSIDVVETLDTDGTATALDTSLYTVDLISEPARIIFTGTIPAGRLHVRYTAGEDSADAVPVTLNRAILLLVGSMYENRQEEYLAPRLVTLRLLDGIERLISNDRLFPFGDIEDGEL